MKSRGSSAVMGKGETIEPGRNGEAAIVAVEPLCCILVVGSAATSLAPAAEYEAKAAAGIRTSSIDEGCGAREPVNPVSSASPSLSVPLACARDSPGRVILENYLIRTIFDSHH
jgi:hypothetical protein